MWVGHCDGSPSFFGHVLMLPTRIRTIITKRLQLMDKFSTRARSKRSHEPLVVLNSLRSLVETHPVNVRKTVLANPSVNRNPSIQGLKQLLTGFFNRRPRRPQALKPGNGSKPLPIFHLFVLRPAHRGFRVFRIGCHACKLSILPLARETWRWRRCKHSPRIRRYAGRLEQQLAFHAIQLRLPPFLLAVAHATKGFVEQGKAFFPAPYFSIRFG